jgi:hypothetical protein
MLRYLLVVALALSTVSISAALLEISSARACCGPGEGPKP